MPGFFDEIFPLYPFLDRHVFESTSMSAGLEQRLLSDHAWAALYYTVLSLGMSYERAGSFAPFEGPSWTIFRRAMGLFPYLLIARPSLCTLQVSNKPRSFDWLRSDMIGYGLHGLLFPENFQPAR